MQSKGKKTTQQIIQSSNNLEHKQETLDCRSYEKEQELANQIKWKQSTINIGIIGHVSHGKSTLIQAITGTKTGKFKEQIRQNMTIKLGFSNAKIFRCPKCQSPQCYKSFPSNCQDHPKCTNQNCTQTLQLIRHVSFCDCPGHHIYMSRMLAGTSVMDSALLLVAANQQCPQPQTVEHMKAIQMMKLSDIIIVQNKIDLVYNDRQRLKTNYKQIKDLKKGTPYQKAAVIPISAQLKYNIDAILQAICELPMPERVLNTSAKMVIIRSFDVNKPGTSIDQLRGGIVGGAILEGVLQIGMNIQIRPGICRRDVLGNIKCTPIQSKIVSLSAQSNSLQYAIPGGLIGVGLLIDPSLSRKDKLVGNILGEVGTLPEIYTQLIIRYRLMKHFIVQKKKQKQIQDKQQKSKIKKISQIVKGETLKVHILSTKVMGEVINKVDDIITVKLSKPICCDIGSTISVNRQYQKQFRLIGHGQIKNGTISQIQTTH